MIVTTIVGFCVCYMFCYAFLYVRSSFAIILMGKRDLVTLLSVSSWCLVLVVWLFIAVSYVCLQFAIVVFPDHTRLSFCNREIWLLCSVCLPDVWCSLCGSSSRCHTFVCSLRLWYFLITLAYYFVTELWPLIDIRISFWPNILKTDWYIFTKFWICIEIVEI